MTGSQDPSDLTGAGSLVMNGAGTLELSAANTFSGGIIIENGTVDLDILGASGSGPIAFQNVAVDPTVEFTPATAPRAPITGFTTGDNIQIDGFTEQSGTYLGNVLTLHGLDASDKSITITLDMPGLQPSNFAGSEANGNFTLSFGTNQTEIACYCGGTLIGTTDGDVPVESLSIGD